MHVGFCHITALQVRCQKDSESHCCISMHFVASMLTTGGESSQPVEKSSDAVPAAVTNSYQVEAQLRLVVEVVSVVILSIMYIMYMLPQLCILVVESMQCVMALVRCTAYCITFLCRHHVNSSYSQYV